MMASVIVEKGKTMYNSPINIIYGQMKTQMEGDILRAVQQYDINVDKEELIRALRYERNQYEKGYDDGKRDAMAELVRCKDCKHNCTFDTLLYCDHVSGLAGSVSPDGYCYLGEREET